ncbi:hypothetical protein [Planococcus salinus]|uniref:Uncharacterized protein n=1 Tax=Planococcus salinus TaxID=1848460 RepID=A0A3M8P6E9_9BACL|nr:hypothetical protein [Planococcus salinus]RNF38850.1 hypothetical protein EEX84_12070 [Planococcus salinus]
MKKAEKIMLEQVIDWNFDTGGYSLCHASLGPGGEICLLFASSTPDLLEGSFPPIRTAEAITYKALFIKDETYSETTISNQKWNYHFLQPMGEDHLLLACARSMNYGGGRVDENARLFDREGNFIRSFCLGDGIEHLYTTGDGRIWTGYFDEGIFGNYGWDDPIGKAGLICWDAFGNISELYEQPNAHFIADCYALNVASDDEVWFYFYTDFHIGKRKNGKTEYFIPDINGATAFAVCQHLLLFNGGYGIHDRFYLFEKNASRYRRRREIVFVNSAGKKLKPLFMSARGSKVLLQCDTASYVFDLKSLAKDHS